MEVHAIVNESMETGGRIFYLQAEKQNFYHWVEAIKSHMEFHVDKSLIEENVKESMEGNIEHRDRITDSFGVTQSSLDQLSKVVGGPGSQQP